MFEFDFVRGSIIARKNQLPGLSVIGTQVENGLKYRLPILIKAPHSATKRASYSGIHNVILRNRKVTRNNLLDIFSFFLVKERGNECAK